jgi:hypothetical protein
MRMPRRLRSLAEVDAHLYDFASGHAEILLLQIDARDSWLLRMRRLHRQRACCDQHGYRDGSYCFHLDSFPLTIKSVIELLCERDAVFVGCPITGTLRAALRSMDRIEPRACIGRVSCYVRRKSSCIRSHDGYMAVQNLKAGLSDRQGFTRIARERDSMPLLFRGCCQPIQRCCVEPARERPGIRGASIERVTRDARSSLHSGRYWQRSPRQGNSSRNVRAEHELARQATTRLECGRYGSNR